MMRPEWYSREDWERILRGLEERALTGNTMEMLRYLASWSLLDVAIPEPQAMMDRVNEEITAVIKSLGTREEG